MMRLSGVGEVVSILAARAFARHLRGAAFGLFTGGLLLVAPLLVSGALWPAPGLPRWLRAAFPSAAAGAPPPRAPSVRLPAACCRPPPPLAKAARFAGTLRAACGRLTRSARFFFEQRHLRARVLVAHRRGGGGENSGGRWMGEPLCLLALARIRDRDDDPRTAAAPPPVRKCVSQCPGC